MKPIVANFQNLADRIHTWIASWKRKELPLAGRATLLQSVLASILRFVCVPLPMTILVHVAWGGDWVYSHYF